MTLSDCNASVIDRIDPYPSLIDANVKKKTLFEKMNDTLKSAAELAMDKAQEAAAAMSSNPMVEISQKELEELKAQAAKAQENWDRSLRIQADLENYRKRAAREKQDVIKNANERLLNEILPAIDHFEMGLQSAQKSAESDSLRQGMEMVLAQLQQFLKSQGVTEVEALGQNFDPSLHEAVAHQESELPEGQVSQQLRKGYRLSDKLLRPATVIVSKGPAVKAEEAPES